MIKPEKRERRLTLWIFWCVFVSVMAWRRVFDFKRFASACVTLIAELHSFMLSSKRFLWMQQSEVWKLHLSIVRSYHIELHQVFRFVFLFLSFFYLHAIVINLRYNINRTTIWNAWVNECLSVGLCVLCCLCMHVLQMKRMWNKSSTARWEMVTIDTINIA